MERARAASGPGYGGAPEAGGGQQRLSVFAQGSAATTGRTEAEGERSVTGVPARIAAAVLRAYKTWLSPMLPRACRFTPTCSEYARLAILEHGVVEGGIKACGRLCRCQPFHPGGVELP